MTTYPFYKGSTKNITKIGTAGGWVKPSTGYSFKNCEKYSLRILDNIKERKDLRIIPKNKYYFLDQIWVSLGASILASGGDQRPPEGSLFFNMFWNPSGDSWEGISKDSVWDVCNKNQA